MPSYNALPLELLAEEFAKLPSIGMKTAQRLAYYIISQPEEDVQAFADALVSAKKKIHPCPCCQNLTDLELCSICADDTRDHSIICVVEGPKDVSALERTGEYTGVYHVLHGLISPIDGIMPDKLRIRELLARLQKGGVQEVIIHILFYAAFSRPLQSSWPSADRGAEYETRQNSTKSPRPRGSSDPPPAKQTHL